MIKLLIAKLLHDRRTTKPAPRPPTRHGVLILGDDHAAHGDWQQWLPELTVTNHATAGETIEGLTRRLATVVNEPAVIVLHIGAADLDGHGRSTDPTDIAVQFETLIALLGVAAPTAQLIVTGLLPDTAEHAETNLQLNRHYRRIITRHGGRWIDLWTTLTIDSESLEREFTAQSGQLNATGYATWIDHLRSEISVALVRR